MNSVLPRAFFPLVLLSLLLSPGVDARPPGGRDGGSPDPVRARLIAESSVVVPSSSVWLGVHLDQDPGWHTYWKNGGDSGQPTHVEWTLPEGWTIGSLQWPAPHRYIEGGDLVTYGYEGDVLLIAELRAPASASKGESISVGAKVEWLMCKDLCIPDSAELNLKLEIGDQIAEASPRDRALFLSTRERLPRPLEATDEFTLDTFLELNAIPPGQKALAGLSVKGLKASEEPHWIFFPDYLDELYAGLPSARWLDGGELRIFIPLEIYEDAAAGRVLDYGGVLELQMDASTTRFIQVDLEIPLASDGQEIQDQSGDFFAMAPGHEAATEGALPGSFAATTVEQPTRSIFYYLFFALLGGIILNVMPCVLPVLSLKVMSFVKHANESRARQIRLGMLFAAGVLVSFLALALVVIGLQAAGDQIGWGFQFQNPVFVVVMAVVVFAFGLSLFGVFEIVLPMGMSAHGSSRSADAESFFNGVLATALATPCTAPFMGPALGFAFTRSAPVILAIFLMVGLGLALPYVLLSINPAWLRFVPKPGPWMNRFKQSMGFLLMATLLWLVWVLGQQLGIEAMVRVLSYLLVLAFALWLWGFLVDFGSSNRRRTIVLLVVLALAVGGWWSILSGSLSADPSAAVAGSSAAGSHGDRWIPFSVEKLEESVNGGKTVFMDFTAAWCWTCKVNERTVLSTDEVQARFDELGVVTLLGDWTQRDPVITQFLRRFQRSGVPFYAVFPAGKLDGPIVLPEVITKQIVLDALDEAGPSLDLR